MKTKFQKSTGGKTNMRPMCAQYSLSQSLLTAFGQTDKNSDSISLESTSLNSPNSDGHVLPNLEASCDQIDNVSEPSNLEITSKNSPNSAIDILPYKDPAAVTTSSSPKRRRISSEPGHLLNEEQEIKEQTIEDKGELNRSDPAPSPPTAAVSDAGPSPQPERDVGGCDPDWFVGLETLPLLLQPLARGELETRRSALWMRVKHEHRVALAFARLHRRPAAGGTCRSETANGSQSSHIAQKRAPAARWLRALARRPRRQADAPATANAKTLVTSEATK